MKSLLVAEKNVILVVYNRLSKIIYFITIIERMLTEGIVYKQYVKVIQVARECNIRQKTIFYSRVGKRIECNIEY